MGVMSRNRLVLEVEGVGDMGAGPVDEASGVSTLSSFWFWFSPVSVGKPVGYARWYC